MKVSKGKSSTRGVSGSYVTSQNYKRIRNAGRRGTKNFRDPNKLFVGNLPYNATEADILNFLEKGGYTTDMHIGSVKIIRDWKTHDSKGYAFVQFTDPIFATGAMNVLNGLKINERSIVLKQGGKKKEEQVYFVKKGRGYREKNILEEEEGVILEGLSVAVEEAKGDNMMLERNKNISKSVFGDESLAEDIVEAKFDNSVIEFDEDYKENEYEDGYSAVWDESDHLNDTTDDLDNFIFDGFYEEEYEDVGIEEDIDLTVLNRSERREMEKVSKKQKRVKPGRGFGTAKLPRDFDTVEVM
eukprot:CAMPEP_0113311842 /NCGR_PEP_ID=MMETSP0010_2-20120614/8907_1 /TAXON_ID=216773 ORGANISM="Corethron hystrix, Strain 308" /NCGR_SAMPLE_ID=MMETSP0010_2 /ASSEMBLY_ACC=CAM_ASM_000155 /LENGTH=298 /DNA_ID=CAMNT_0000167541 /DNA_START=654 /DNA_END=1550 /DNA_ORIENTATION=- /assembly_acc=CAM_ASM_000155